MSDSEGKIVTMSDFLTQDLIKAKIGEMLKGKAPQFITSVISLVGNDEKLKTVDKVSLLNACLTAASMDLPVNQNLGLAYIIPYKDKAQLQIGYKGFMQLAVRSGQFETISSTPIYEGQLTEENPLTGFKFDFSVARNGEPIGYAAYFKTINGFEKTMYMTVEELKKHGKKYSQTYKKHNSGLWEDNFDAMATKTVLKLLLSKFAPLSIDIQKAAVVDQAVINDWEGNELDYADNKPLDSDEVSKEKQEARIKKFIDSAVTENTLEEPEIVGFMQNLPDDHELKKLYNEKKAELKKKVD
jgi:recombination protein RecT